ncbi:MAG: hypothetical protein ACREQI_17265 [Candidatus Binataceae bacterium]
MSRHRKVFRALLAATGATGAGLALILASNLFGARNEVRTILSRAASATRIVGIAHAQPDASPTADTCAGGTLAAGDPNNIPSNPPDLLISGPCMVTGGPGGAGNAKHYFYSNVNIVKGGSLNFQDAQIDFWAKSVIVENNGSLMAGSSATPIGTAGRGPVGASGTMRSVVTINLWGPQQADPANGSGVECKSPLIQPPADHPKWEPSPCGIPVNDWNNGDDRERQLDNGVKDYFYKYGTLPFDGADPNAYFGYKVLAVSYGGTIQMFGTKGALEEAQAVPKFPLMTGTSWTRLDQGAAKILKKGDTQFYVAGNMAGSWEAGDDIVVTSTDYMPGHSEQLRIASVSYDSGTNRTLITLDTANGAAVQWTHNGSQYDLTNVSTPDGAVNVQTKLSLNIGSVDTRAAVALLSRSIVIQSGGNTINIAAQDGSGINQPFPVSAGYFGGDTIFRAGFQAAEMQGVEFHQLGQGGEIGHYPVHFHLARAVPAQRAFIKDCSINESMTRWIVLHGTDGATLARNVGYESIGHGFFLEDATEVNNNLYSNLGIFARAAVQNIQNPRMVPGIFARPNFNPNNTPSGDFASEVPPFHTDWDHPTVFWITNGWNDFEGNMAAGAGTCGNCYWLVPSANGGMSIDEKWTGYASLQKSTSYGDIDRAGISPLKVFYDNSCSSAMTALQTVGNTAPCLGVGSGESLDTDNLEPVPNNLAPPFISAALCTGKGTPLACCTNPQQGPTCAVSDFYKMYYPNTDFGGYEQATRCDTPNGDCSTVKKCANGEPESNCAVNVIDRFTTSFNWAQINFAAIWLRQYWYLVINSVITDSLHGGLSFVSGGDYTKSSAPPGYWALAKKSVFIGTTQAGNPYASNAGPYNNGPLVTNPGISCGTQSNGVFPGNRCVSKNDGVAYPLDNYSAQRLFSIYDGPAYEESNAYLDITKSTLAGCTSSLGIGLNPDCTNSYPATRVAGVMRDNSQPGGPGNLQCYLPNAAIGWKQPNGFYYPPAFHSANLFFNNVDIRHFVIEPELMPGTFYTDPVAQAANYCTTNTGAWTGFTDIDRQTELNDDDGSLTGLADTISVNQDPFFNAPLDTVECASNVAVGVYPTPYPTPTFLPLPTPTATPTGGPTPTVTPIPTPGPTPILNFSPLATARTSPYDYVTTVVYPKCATEITDKKTGATTCGDTLAGRGGDWSSDCGSGYCYGVPLYRQYLTGSEGSSSRPFIRMMAQSTYQRSNLTVNHGVYYIDTTKTKTQQNTENWTPSPVMPRSVNVFKSNNTYYVFFVFAKDTTEQTYQMYVGPGFDPTPSNDQVFLTRVRIPGKPFVPEKKDADAWKKSGWTKSYNSATGILTVHIDMSKFAKDLNPVIESSGLCKPISFCDWTGKMGEKTCGCSATAADYPVLTADSTLAADCSAICSKWAVKDLDCPDDGCYGFGVTLPSGFTDAINAIPAPTSQPTPACFPTTSAWTSPGFVPVTAAVAGKQCTYSGKPASNFCQ